MADPVEILADYGVSPETIEGHQIITQESAIDYNLSDVLRSSRFWEIDVITGNWILRTLEEIAMRADRVRQIEVDGPAARIAMTAAIDRLAPHLPPQRDGPSSASVRGVAYDLVYSFDPSCFFEHETYDAAIRKWEKNILSYVATHKGDALYWRYRPEIQPAMDIYDSVIRWGCRSRLAIV